MMKHRTDCRICKSKDLEMYLDLGEMPSAGGFLTKEQFKDEKAYPLRIYFCKNCSGSQLLDLVGRDELFKEYFYLSSSTKTLSNHFKEFAKEIKGQYLKDPKGLVVEIGSNDGVLLSPLKELGIWAIGVEPSKNVSSIAKDKGLFVVTDFFTPKVAKRIENIFGNADIVTASNVFAHLDELDEMIEAIKIMLKQDGIFIFEVHYFLDLFQKMQYDTFYHEHFCYYTVKALQKLFWRFGMELYDVQRIPIHAGSIRGFVRRRTGELISKNVKALLKLEEDSGLSSIDTYRDFAKKVEENKGELITLLGVLKGSDMKIIGYGAPGRGNTLLNYCNIGPELLDYVTDESPLRAGKFIPKQHIPIVSPNQMKKNKPDYALLLAWSYFDEVIKKEKEFLDNGGEFIVPLPEIRLVGRRDL